MSLGLLRALVMSVLLVAQSVSAGAHQPARSSSETGPLGPALRAGIFQLRNIVGGALTDLAVRNNRAYAILGSMLGVFDITNPASPVRLRYLALPAEAASIQLAGNFAYVLTGGNSGAKALQIMDITDPDELVLVANQNLGFAYRMLVASGHLFVFSLMSIDVYDLRQPAKPVLVGQFSSSSIGT